MLVAMFLLSEVTLLFDLSRYLDRSLGSAKASQKVKLPIDCLCVCLCGFMSVHLLECRR